MDKARELGADVAVDYGRPAWPDAVRDAIGDRPITITLDGVGGRLGRQALELVAVGGRVVLYGASSGQPTELSAGDLFARGLTASAAVGARLMARPGGLRHFEALSLDALADGRLTPLVGQRFPLSAAAAAHRAIEARATMGKTVLIP